MEKLKLNVYEVSQLRLKRIFEEFDNVLSGVKSSCMHSQNLCLSQTYNTISALNSS